MAMNNSIASRIEAQQRLVDSIRAMQQEERDLRAGILEELFGMEVVGTQKTMVNNLVVTGEYGLTYKFAQDALDEAIQEGRLSEEALNGIRVKYELDKKVYNALSESATEELNEFLTITPSLPTLKVKAEAEE
ncbi:hypothetical protein ACJ8S7_005094 [Klebsiella pneumoniae]|nr:hypothetical protein [Klebsiella pneumoniae]